MTTIRPRACTAQYTDDHNTWACSGRHLGRDHVVYFPDGAHLRWGDDHDQPDPDRYRELDQAVGRLVGRLRGRATDPDVRAVVAAYDQLHNPGTGMPA